MSEDAYLTCMDSAVLLDLLGNENRRRILRLLAHKPCYVTEISEYLGVSPKAVIDHLRKLEEAGLIESTTNDKRRKYFRIARSLRLEVSLSPYGFGAKSAYPASQTLDMGSRCTHLTLDVSLNKNPDGIAGLISEFTRLESLDRELSMAQRWVHGRMTEVLEALDERLGVEADSRFFAEVLAAVVATDGTAEAVINEITAPPEAVGDALKRLSDAGVLRREGRRYFVR